ncbi:MAG: LPXTG cell wall anchor domain-containing protein [Eubacteriales bacterium]
MEDTVISSLGASSQQTPSQGQQMDSPQTGDSSNIVMWIAVAVLAAGAMAVTVLFARKKKAE